MCTARRLVVTLALAVLVSAALALDNARSEQAQKPSNQQKHAYSNTAEAKKDCAGNNVDLRIQGCGYLIERHKLRRKQRASALAVRGYAYLLKHDWSHAIADFKASLRADRRQVQVYYYSGLAYRLSGDYKHAIAEFTRAIKIAPKSAGPYADRGAARAASGDTKGALADYAKAIALAPKNAYAYSERAALYAGQGKDKLALADYDKAIALNPKDFQVFRERGNLLLSDGLNDKAISDFNRAIALYGKDIQSYRARALAYAVTGNYAAAIADLNKITSLVPTYGEGYRVRASIEENLQLYDRALADLNQALHVNKSDVEALISRARLLALTGKPQVGLADANQAVALAPSTPDAFLGRAFVRARIKKSDDAMKDINVAMTLAPKSAAVHIGIAEVLAELDQYPAAIANLNLALRDVPGSAQALEQRCGVYVALGDKVRALADCRNALAIRPSVKGYLLSSGLEASPYLAIRDLQNALKLNPNLTDAKNRIAAIGSEADKTIKSKPEVSAGYATRGWVEWALGQAKQAQADLTKAVDLKTKDGSVYLGLGLLAKDRTAKTQFYDKAIALDSTLADAYFQRGKLRAYAAKYDSALVDLAQALRLDPRQSGAKKLIRQALFPATMTMRMHPKDVRLLVASGVAYAAIGESDKAIAALDKAVAMTPGNAIVLFFRGRSYYWLGDRKRAVADLEKAQAAAPNNSQIKNLMEKVRKSGG